jgi:CRISPR-associated protein Cas1
MTNRILDFATADARLRVELGQLVVERTEAPRTTVPLVEVAAVVISNPRVTCTQSLLAGLMSARAALIVCDEAHLPVGLMLPIAGHCTQGERFLAQASAPKPLRKRLWQQIVRAKIGAQAAVLSRLYGDDAGLSKLRRAVRSGDIGNVEAQAAVRYWPRLFHDTSFRRQRAAPDRNRLLNYGYTVLRAIVARAICAAGLHPSLGIHHHNRYDAYCLADDLLEPLRPIVDEVVVHVVTARGSDCTLDSHVKRELLTPLLAPYTDGVEARSLFDWAGRMASSLVSVYLRHDHRLYLPPPLLAVESVGAGD